MDIFNAGMQPVFDKRLDRREVELHQLIDSTNQLAHGAGEAERRGVVDFKDAADQQALATVDEAMAEHAVHELNEVIDARRRLADHDYGLCADCGEAIDLGRLLVLAATPCCTTCQAIREQGQSVSRPVAPTA